MKKAMIGIFCSVALLFAVASAQALTINLVIGGDDYVGYWTPANPADPSDEVLNTNFLITLTTGAATPYNGQTFYRDTTPLILGLPTAANFDQLEPESFVFTNPGSYYVLGKYDAGNAGEAVWFVTTVVANTEIDLPDNWTGSQYGLSHVTVGGSTTNVPEPMTMLLLGLGLVGLAGVGRRFKK